MDVGEGNAPVSVHVSVGQSEDFIQLQDGDPFVILSTRYIPLISAEFGESCVYKLLVCNLNLVSIEAELTFLITHIVTLIQPALPLVLHQM